MNRLAAVITGASILGYGFSAVAAETTEAQGSGGMPQLDPSSFGTQIFWLTVTFSALYFLLSKKVLPSVESVIDERNGRIQGDLDSAAKFRQEAEELYASYEAQLSAASTSAQATIAAVKTKMSETIAERTSALQSDLDRRLEATMSELAASSEVALGNVEAVAAEVAIDAVERLIGIKVSAEEAHAAAHAVR